MTVLPTAQQPQVLDDAEAALESASAPAQVEAAPALTLITEQEVVFSTAAVIPVRRTRWWTPASIAAAMRGVFVASSADARPKRRTYPPRATYLEYSRMEREMHRL
jgi:hypothetical protein